MNNIIESIEYAGYGRYKVVCMYRNQRIEGLTNNSLAYDRLRNTDISYSSKSHYGYTTLQALKSLRSEIINYHLKTRK